MKLQSKVRAGEQPFQHHTADEDNVTIEDPYRGVSEAAAVSDPAFAIGAEFFNVLEADVDSVEIKAHLKEYQIVYGLDFKMGIIAMVVCKSGMTWEEKVTEEEQADPVKHAKPIADRLFDFVKRCVAISKESNTDRICRERGITRAGA